MARLPVKYTNPSKRGGHRAADRDGVIENIGTYFSGGHHTTVLRLHLGDPGQLRIPEPKVQTITLDNDARSTLIRSLLAGQAKVLAQKAYRDSFGSEMLRDSVRRESLRGEFERRCEALAEVQTDLWVRRELLYAARRTWEPEPSTEAISLPLDMDAGDES